MHAGREKHKLLARVWRRSAPHSIVRLGAVTHSMVSVLLLRSPYLLLVALFLLLMTWISTIVYIQLGDLITKAFVSREARTQVYAGSTWPSTASRWWFSCSAQAASSRASA
jgi:ATP/ADP translocase